MNNAKKLWSCATLSLISGASLLNASDEARIRNIENRITSIETSKNCCCMINPPARPYASECWGFYVTVDPLVWQGHVNGLGFAIETNDGATLYNPTGVVGQSRVKNLDFDWTWGFRLGLGVNLPHDGWDVLLQWTRWNSSANRNVTAGENQTLFPVLEHPASALNQIAGSASADWDLELNMLDLELGRQFYVSRCLTIRPHAGLRTSWIKQELDVKYKDVSSLLPPSFVSQNVEENIRSWGMGIRGGVDLQWGLGNGWSMFSNYATSLLYNYYAVSHKEDTIADDEVKTNILNVGNFYHQGTSITDMQIGFRFDWISCDECMHFGFDLGWEHHYFPGQNQAIQFTDADTEGKFFSNQGDLATQGYFMKVRFDF